MTLLTGPIPDNAPDIIREAAKSPLGIFALMILLLGVIALAFFRKASEKTRIGIFVLIFVGVVMFGVAIAQKSAVPEIDWLALQVSNIQGRPVKGAILNVRGTDLKSEPTSDTGSGRLPLRPHTKADTDIALQLIEPQDHIMLAPLYGHIRTPASEESFVEVLLAKPGESVLDSTKAVEALASQAVMAASRLQDPEARRRLLDDVSEKVNADPAELYKAVQNLKVQSPNPEAQKLASDFEAAFPYAFTMSEELVSFLRGRSAVQRKLRVSINARGSVHSLESDCEMHIAGNVEGLKLGSPDSIVAEPPNVCRFPPPEGSVHQWPAFLDEHVLNRPCEVTGFFRIFVEARGTGPVASPSNPRHVFEFHPVSLIECSGVRVSFEKFLKVFPGMRAGTPATTTNCINSRTLEGRFASDTREYQFRETGSRCGNFAVIGLRKLVPGSFRSAEGGHIAEAVVTTDGATTVTLKLYTLSQTLADEWLVRTASHPSSNQHSKSLHGLLTYDEQAILKAMESKPEAWTKINTPLAIVVFDQVVSAPWE